MKRLPIVLALCALVACTHAGVAPRARSSPRASRPAVPLARPGDFVFAVKGDWGAGTADQYAITARMCAIRKRATFTDVVTVGDNFYDPDGIATRANFYLPEVCLLKARITWHASWGNHDGAGTSTAKVLGATNPWYAWSSHGVDFFALDTEQESSPQQTAWLATHLRASSAAVKIVYFHKPPYTVGSVHDPDAVVQRDWVPLFERYHVTMVINGHEHDYEHLLVNGVHYVITGGGGATLYGCVRSVPHLVRCLDSYEFLLVAVHGATVTVNAIDDAGQRIDRFSIAARG